MGVLLTIYIHYFPFTFSNIWLKNRLSDATETIVALVVSDNGKYLFGLFITLIHSYDYGVTYFWLTYLIWLTVCFNKISTGFVAITENKVTLNFVLFLRLYWIYYLKNMKTLFKSYWPFIKITYHLIFQTYDSKLALCFHSNHSFSSNKWQR